MDDMIDDMIDAAIAAEIVPAPLEGGAEVLSLEQMLQRLVYADRTGGYVVLPRDDEDTPAALLDVPRASERYRASKTRVPTAEGKSRLAPTFELLRADPRRRTVDAAIFATGHPRFLVDPDTGLNAVNLWTPRRRGPPPADWEARAALFLEHVAFLMPDAEERGRFLDWLAHIEQCPGVLPHYGHLHIARRHGLGRNWLSAVLARVWPGAVAEALNIAALLNSSYNAVLAGRLLAVVDEVHLASDGRGMFAVEAQLRDLMTAARRLINPKYGRQHVELNACRWLLFSNAPDALPIPEGDRRFAVIECEARPRDADYYVALYRALDDPLFIASVAAFLALRDIAGFNPGARPAMNAAKLAVIEAAAPQHDRDLAHLLSTMVEHDVDHVAASDLMSALAVRPGDPARSKHFGLAMDRAGWRKLERAGARRGRMTLNRREERIWCAPGAVERGAEDIVQMIQGYRVADWFEAIPGDNHGLF